MRGRLLRAVLALALLAGRAHADELYEPPADDAPRIVNGLYTSLYPSTGALLDSPTFTSAALLCSGTLIGCETFLTAGHCVEGNLNPGAYSVFLQHAGFFQVSSIALHPSYNFPVADIAVLKLATPVTGVAPTPINPGPTPAFGTAGTIAGFGRSGGVNFDYGLKRAGAVTTGSCAGTVSNTTSVCWSFANPLGSSGSNSNTCNGDSGGPLFVNNGSGTVVAGVTSGGDSSTCLPTDNSYDANVAFYSSYIQAEGGADLANTTCGTGPQAGGPNGTILAATGSLGSVSEGRHSFSVGSGLALLRVAMNAVDDGSDFDLYVKAGSPPTTTDYDCRQYGSNQYGFCEFPAPAAGAWHVLVNRFSGAGLYQVTTTIFGVDCTLPANAGQPCDDGNVCTGGDTCQAGACTGTPVANGVSCNDGNDCTTTDTCQTGSCTGAPSADGTPCDDGRLCTFDDQCQAGTCTGAAPAPECKLPTVPLRGVFQLKRDTFNHSRDRLVWRWASGAQTDKSEFGNPLLTSPLGLCVYDESGGVPQLIMERTIPAGTFWTETAVGFKYVDRGLTNSGFRAVTLKSGIQGRANIVVKAQGDGIGMVPLPLAQDGSVTVQLLNSSGCWQGRYSTSVINQGDQFKARPD